MNKKMAYVACDPKQPGAAYAAIVDRGDNRHDVAEALSTWLTTGEDSCFIERATLARAKEMMANWEG
jgi:hypothetical protein